MLPLELLRVIFGALSRDDLDTVMLANVSFRDIVLRDFAKEPLRYFEALNIRAHQCYKFVLTKGNRLRCWDKDDFKRRMRFGRVRELLFSTGALFDENIFDVLLPLKDAWRDGCVCINCTFASQSLFERAFSELLFCESISAYPRVIPGNLSYLFLSLPAVRECASLRIFFPTIRLTTVDITAWLNADARSEEPKRLETGDYLLADSVDNLVQHLKTDFTESKSARRYVVKIGVDAYDGPLGPFFNKHTSEELTISRSGTNTDSDFVQVERKSVDDN